MLDLAASRGLQIIILSCNPDEYVGFGARQIALSIDRAFGGSPARALVAIPDGADASTALNVVETYTGGPRLAVEAPDEPIDTRDFVDPQDERARAFLSALVARGGTQGNGTLRKELGWDESVYEEVKLRLVSGGLIRPGRGRGGSVSINQVTEE